VQDSPPQQHGNGDYDREDLHNLQRLSCGMSVNRSGAKNAGSEHHR
jgi:hypothetical protein